MDLGMMDLVIDLIDEVFDCGEKGKGWVVEKCSDFKNILVMCGWLNFSFNVESWLYIFVFNISIVYVKEEVEFIG